MTKLEIFVMGLAMMICGSLSENAALYRVGDFIVAYTIGVGLYCGVKAAMQLYSELKAQKNK